MRILQVIPTFFPTRRYGGPITAVHALCKHLAERGHKISVYTTNVDGPFDLDVPLDQEVCIDNISVHYFAPRFLRRLYFAPGMVKALKDNVNEFDVIHLHSIFLWPTNIAARIAKRNSVPYIVSPRGMLVRKLINRKSTLIKMAWIHMFERPTIENASAVHMTSRLEWEDAQEFKIKYPKVYVIPNGLDVDFQDDGFVSDTSSFTLPNGEDFILYLGRVTWKKGLDILIRAMTHLKQIHLVIAGNDEEAYEPKLKTIAKECGVLDRIIFIGPVYGLRKQALLRMAKCLIMPSLSENFGMVALEAMASGCPVVVTPQVGLAKTIEETHSGVVVQGSPDELGRKISVLLKDKEALRQMSINGQRTWSERFQWSRIARDVEAMYEEVLRTSKGKA